ncbi:MAG: lipoyl(octanoyl) transferase LipB [Alphaproteobacteria bacterium]
MVDIAESAGLQAVEWRLSPGLVPYETAVATMESRVAAIREGSAPELVWALEHPPLYTAGTSAADDELLDPGGLPVYRTGRGGRFTWHGPGQRVAYVMLDLKRRGADVRAFVCDLESWIIATLARFGVKAERREGRIGIWVVRPSGAEEKIAAIGVRVRHWISYHGVAINVAPDLAHFAGIVPCGISEHGVTSLAALGHNPGMAAFDAALRAEFENVFGRTLVPA